jgi:hypothetical protein
MEELCLTGATPWGGFLFADSNARVSTNADDQYRQRSQVD